MRENYDKLPRKKGLNSRKISVTYTNLIIYGSFTLAAKQQDISRQMVGENNSKTINFQFYVYNQLGPYFCAG